jgi:hypothetical protein
VIVDEDAQQKDHHDHPDEHERRHLARPAVVGGRSALIVISTVATVAVGDRDPARGR